MHSNYMFLFFSTHIFGIYYLGVWKFSADILMGQKCHSILFVFSSWIKSLLRFLFLHFIWLFCFAANITFCMKYLVIWLLARWWQQIYEDIKGSANHHFIWVSTYVQLADLGRWNERLGFIWDVTGDTYSRMSHFVQMVIMCLLPSGLHRPLGQRVVLILIALWLIHPWFYLGPLWRNIITIIHVFSTRNSCHKFSVS